mgnify:CR=1 FL=1
MAHNDTHAARKKGGAGKILLVVLLLLLLAVGAAVHFAYNEIHGNGAPGSTEVTVSIPQGSGVAAIANKLKEAGVIRSAYLFRWYVGQKGAAAKLQYGDFVLQTSAISYDAIIATPFPVRQGRNGAGDHPGGHHGHCHRPKDGIRRSVHRRGVF